MTSDFENDEIKDSAFPVDFTDDAESLDQYGVWVKSGPRDVPAESPATAPVQSEPEFPEIGEPGLGLSSDISELPPLPDFDELENPETPENQEIPGDEVEPEPAFPTFGEIDDLPDMPDFSGPIEFEEIAAPSVPERTLSANAGNDSRAESVREHAALESIDSSAFIESSFFDNTESETVSESMPPLADSIPDETPEPAGEIMFEEVQQEDLGSLSSSACTEFAADEQPSAEFHAGPEVESGLSSLEPVGEFPVDSEQFGVEIPSFEPSPETTVAEAGETRIFENAEAFEIDAAAGELPSDEDFSSFLDDLNSGTIAEVPSPVAQKAPSAGDDLDLDSFIDSFNESGGSDHNEEAKLFDDTTPVDIDLEFDESFLDDAQKIKDTGSAVSESEFFNSEFGVELIDESGGSASAGSSDFDIDFASVQYMGAPVQEKSAEKAPSASGGSEITDEFSDLLASLDKAPAPAASAAPKASVSRNRGFNLVVSEEDGMESFSSAVADTSMDENQDVPLFGDVGSGDIKKNMKTFSTETVEFRKPVSFNSGDSIDFEVENETILPSFDELVTDTADRGSPEPDMTEYPDSVAEEVAVETEPEHENVFSPEPVVVPLSNEENIDIPDISEYNSTESGTDNENSVTSAMEENVSLDFDDISAVEQELNDFTPETGDNKVVTNDKSTELLMIIADELSSIKKEISTLKTELAGFKSAGLTAEPQVLPETEGQSENSGFFSDDDTDETIALTGDELNNILITADFTEEKNDEDEVPGMPGDESPASATEESVPEGFIPPDVGESFISDEAPVLASETEPVPAETEPEIPETLPDSIFDIPDLQESVPLEVTHVTTVEEDTSYLEGAEISEPELDNVAIEEPELEIIDFDDEKLEEPELTEFSIDLTGLETDFPSEQEVAVPQDRAEDAEPAGEVVSESFLPPEGVETEAGEISFAATSLSPEMPASVPPVEEETIADIVNTVPFEEPVQEMHEIPVETDLSAEPSPIGNEAASRTGIASLPVELKNEIKSVLSYMDQLLESLPEEKIEEFARSEHFEVYKKLFEELGIS